MTEQAPDLPKCYPCPKCNTEDALMLATKTWKLKGKGKHETLIAQYTCLKCRAVLRIPLKVQQLPTPESNFTVDEKGVVHYKEATPVENTDSPSSK